MYVCRKKQISRIVLNLLQPLSLLETDMANVTLCRVFSAPPPAEQQELAGRGGSDGPAAHGSRSGIRKGRAAELPHHRFAAGEIFAGCV